MNWKFKIIIVIILHLLAIYIVKANDYVFTPVNVSHGLSDNQVRYILQLPDGRMVFTTSGNVNIYNGAHFSYIHRTFGSTYRLSTYDGFYRIYQDSNSHLWIKELNKLFCIDLKTEQYVKNIGNYFKELGVEESVEDMFIDSEHRMWLLTLHGLLRLDTQEYFDLSSNSGNLQDLAVEKDNLYLFYNTGEIVCYSIKTKNQLYSKAAYPEAELENFKNTSLVVKGNDGLYQLRNGVKGGFFFFDINRQIWEKILETDYVLNTLIVAPDETIYISCKNGIWIINRRTGKKEYLPILKTIEGDIINTEISTIFYDKQGGLWLGTLNRGLLYYHPSRYKFTYIGRSYFPEPISQDIMVQYFAEDKSGNIYVKCNFKFYQYKSSSSNNRSLIPIEQSTLSSKIQEKLNVSPQNIFRDQEYTSLYTDSRGWTWAGTQDGLKLFTSDKDNGQTFYTENGLSNNFIQGILEDFENNIWVTTSYGISQIKVDPTTKKFHFVNFNIYDGTLDGEYIRGSIFQASNGTLYFGGIDGFNMLNPSVLSPYNLPFKPILTNLRLRGEDVIIGKKYDDRIILSESASFTDEIQLSYNQNFLTFELSAINYINPTQTFYRYQLVGIDNNWIDTYSKGQEQNDGILRIPYTNLPAGNYILRVMASDNNAEWNGDIYELKITIHAPWWKTTTAYVLYLLFLILIIFVAVYLYTYITKRKLERQHKEEILLLRIRSLIDQCSQYEVEQKKYTDQTKGFQERVNKQQTDNWNFSPTDNVFLARAIEFVEKNINNPDYSVEQLSRDLCMDRTGLYRKLIALLDKSPSLFIRNIRLQRAAQLLLEGELSIAEITDMIGFSSPSYFSKCFQEMYNCRPSEYAEKVKKST
ncbi:helix-turn-helix domain-containing protein [Dysgonomonas sp. Marseille-P4677]|uniref:two-component regulator propeller domain-containing protein n=1 Tax=Dysgonomonas sp. Marseille-P4677 TaxID=2364790 RepID=UPI0019141C5D|nr:two-component regulator propeller domain-containing protein [Dysgonomonas sp. Marseille-P4677]MBK5720334.1 helix-turn-helix domain-containing protein [Dysgonomonas sp. Marseille-P4677]